ncbi:MAG: methyltransferase domain-containing protein [Rhodanobacteraceae bacterium]|nr:methyltransferase domain-containing protein [Rhodanobacteraceae bacterium]
MLLHPLPSPATDALSDVFAQERLELAPECAGVFGRQGLFIGSDRELAAQLAAPMLGRRVGLHLLPRGGFGGDVCCAPGELPFADDSFRLVVLQHAFERIDDAAALREEIVRVLEPGGIAMVVGFARFGVWRPWLAWQERGARQYASALSWRRGLAARGVDVYAQRRIGQAQIAMHGISVRLPSVLRSSWLLLARKRSAAALARSHPVALPQRAVRSNLASGTQRASA